MHVFFDVKIGTAKLQEIIWSLCTSNALMVSYLETSSWISTDTEKPLEELKALDLRFFAATFLSFCVTQIIALS